MDALIKLGANLANARRRAGITTQKEAGERAAVIAARRGLSVSAHPVTICRQETGKGSPTVADLLVYAEVYGVPAASLLPEADGQERAG